MKRTLFTAIIHCFAATAFVILSCGQSLAGNLTWSVRIYSKNPDYLEVFINTKKAEQKTYYINVVCNVSFFSNDKLLKTEAFKFTGDGIEALNPNHVYRKFYKSPIAAVTTVKGGDLNYTKIYGGLKPNPRDEFVLPRDRHPESSPVSPQDVYEATDAVRTVKYLPLPSGLSPEIVASFDRANAYLDQSEYEAAIKEYEAIIAANPELAVVYLYLGQALAENRNCKKAVPIYKKAIQLGRDDVLLVRLTEERISIYCYDYRQ